MSPMPADSRLDSIPVFGLLLAQENVTSATVKWFIAALLLVAALLTVLTVWYWRHTDPRRRVRQTQPRVVDATPQVHANASTDATDGAWFSTASSSPATQAASSRAPGSSSPSSPEPWAPSMVSANSAEDDIEADDWLRLTGPQSLPRDSS